jgi:hypothetical protein
MGFNPKSLLHLYAFLDAFCQVMISALKCSYFSIHNYESNTDHLPPLVIVKQASICNLNHVNSVSLSDG